MSREWAVLFVPMDELGTSHSCSLYYETLKATCGFRHKFKYVLGSIGIEVKMRWSAKR